MIMKVPNVTTTVISMLNKEGRSRRGTASGETEGKKLPAEGRNQVFREEREGRREGEEGPGPHLQSSFKQNDCKSKASHRFL